MADARSRLNTLLQTQYNSQKAEFEEWKEGPDFYCRLIAPFQGGASSAKRNKRDAKEEACQRALEGSIAPGPRRAPRLQPPPQQNPPQRPPRPSLPRVPEHSSSPSSQKQEQQQRHQQQPQQHHHLWSPQLQAKLDQRAARLSRRNNNSNHYQSPNEGPNAGAAAVAGAAGVGARKTPRAVAAAPRPQQQQPPEEEATTTSAAAAATVKAKASSTASRKRHEDSTRTPLNSFPHSLWGHHNREEALLSETQLEAHEEEEEEVRPPSTKRRAPPLRTATPSTELNYICQTMYANSRPVFDETEQRRAPGEPSLWVLRLTKPFQGPASAPFVKKAEAREDGARRAVDSYRQAAGGTQYVYNSKFGSDEDREHEFKEVGDAADKARGVAVFFEKYVCGFLNSRGGTIYFGIADDRTIYGIPLTDKDKDYIRLNLDSTVATFFPQVNRQFYGVQLFPVANAPTTHHYVVEVRVEKGDRTPYRTAKRRCYIRCEGSTMEASNDEIDSMIRDGPREMAAKMFYMKIQKMMEDLRDAQMGHTVNEILPQDITLLRLPSDSVSELGTGRFGQVVRGIWHRAKVALKIPKDTAIWTVPASKQIIEEIRTEVAIHQELVHPNIVRVFGACLVPEFTCIVMELADQGTLAAYLEANSKTDALRASSKSQRMDAMFHVCAGMKFLHSRNIVHHDLKSLNILLRSEGEDVIAKISDFGFARLESNASRNLTEQRGTPAWTAPEYFKRGAPYTRPCDVYSFGVVAYEILTLSLPYPGIDEMRLEDLVCSGKRPTDYVPLPADTSGNLQRIVAACFTANPLTRPTFSKILDKLEEHLTPQSILDE